MQIIQDFMCKLRIKYEIGYVYFVRELTMDELSEIGNLPVVYVLFNGSEMQYIGQTFRLDSRIKTHKKDKEFDRVVIVYAQDIEDSKYIEFDMVRHFRPKYNSNYTHKRVNCSYDRSDSIMRQNLGVNKTSLYYSMTTTQY